MRRLLFGGENVKFIARSSISLARRHDAGAGCFRRRAGGGSLAKPVLAMRNATKRPEALATAIAFWL